jgi:hypothetical protein
MLLYLLSNWVTIITLIQKNAQLNKMPALFIFFTRIYLFMFFKKTGWSKRKAEIEKSSAG